MKLFIPTLRAKVNAIPFPEGLRKVFPHLLLAVYVILVLSFLNLPAPKAVVDQSAAQDSNLRAALASLRESASLLAMQAVSLSPVRALDQTAFRAADEAHKRALDAWTSHPDIGILKAGTASKTEPATTQALQSFITQQRKLRKDVADIFAAKQRFDAAFNTLPLAKRELALALKNDKLRRYEDIITSVDSTHVQVKDLLLLADAQRSKLMLENLEERQARLAKLAPTASAPLKAVFDKLALLIRSNETLKTQAGRLDIANMDQLAETLITSLSVPAKQIDAQGRSLWTTALLFFLSLVPVLGLYLVLINTQRKLASPDEQALQNTALSPADSSLGFDTLVASGGGASQRHHATLAAPTDSMPQPETHDACRGNLKEMHKNTVNQSELAREVCYLLDTPLVAIEKHIDALCPILSEVHEAFDHIDQQPGLRKVAPAIAALNDAGSITELPFLVADIQEGLRSARQVTQNLTSIVTHPNDTLEVLELNQLIKQVLRSKADDLGAGTSVRLKLAPEPVEIMANPARMRLALESLISNAAEAIKAASVVGGLIELHTSQQHDRVKFTIRDNGCGMEAEALTRIFEPFFTTKKQKPGAGMGLSYVKAHVEQVGGKVDIVSNLNKGTMARLSFPSLSHEMRVEREEKGAPAAAIAYQPAKHEDQRRVKALSLNTIVQEVVQRKNSEIQAKTNVSLGLTKQSVELKAVPVDLRFLVSRVVDSFLARARPNARQSNRLRITTQRKTECVVLTVRDNAKIEGAELETKLNAGVERVKNRDDDLASLTKMVDAYNGRIDIANTSDGGTIVRISLPTDRRLAEVTQDKAGQKRLRSDPEGSLAMDNNYRPSAEIISLNNASNDDEALLDEEARYGDEGIVSGQDKNWLTLV